MLDVIGTIMIVRISAAGRRPACDGSPLKSGMKPNQRSEPRLEVRRDPGAEDENAPEAEDHARDRREQLDQRRRPAPRIQRGASSVRKSAIAIESGVAISERDDRRDEGAVDEVERAEGPG